MELNPGVLFGPYRLLEPAGVGTADVWKAYHPGLRRSVTLRILPSHLAAQPASIERLWREVRALSRLLHPNILDVQDFGEQDGSIYLVTPFVSGLTLDHLLGEPWPAAEAVLVLEPLASVLDYAHARGIVHGDVKPSNVLVGDRGQVLLDGFGIRWALEDAATPGRHETPRQPGQSIRRPRHLAPESVMGQPPSPAADRYALGTIAFELLTGRPPFEVETWPAELQPQPPNSSPLPCSLSPTLSMPVIAVLFRALAEKPNDRFPTARDLVKALTTADQPVSAEPESAPHGGQAAPDQTRDDRPSPTAVQKARLAREPDEARRETEGPATHGLGWRKVRLRRVLAGLSGAALAASLVWVVVLQPALAEIAGRGGHAVVTLEGGEVLVVGGCTSIPASHSVAGIVRALRSFGTKPGPGWLDTAILYAPTSSNWRYAGRMSQARCDLRAAPLLAGRALVVGGSAGAGQSFATAERYDRSNNSWTSANKLLIARRDFTLTALASGHALVVGGLGTAERAGSLASAERYDPTTNNWSLAASVNEARRSHSATLLADGQLLVAGGAAAGSGALASAERWNPATNAWTSAGSMQQARANHTATLLFDGRVLVAGGSGERNALASAETYDPTSNTWTRVAAMAQARAGHTATLLPEGQVLVVAGSGLSGDLDTAERYDPSTNTWLTAGSLPRPRARHSASLLPSGGVLVVGGRLEPDDGLYLHTADIYDPAENRWNRAADMPP